MDKSIHVTPKEGKWVVESGSRVHSQHGTQAEAITAGRKLARAEQAEFVIHGRDGRIREKDSYGHDPHPPAG